MTFRTQYLWRFALAFILVLTSCTWLTPTPQPTATPVSPPQVPFQPESLLGPQTPGTWLNVTPAAWSCCSGTNIYGGFTMVHDLNKPQNFYTFASDTNQLWESTDYGLNWTLTPTNLNFGNTGVGISIAPSVGAGQPTLYAAGIRGLNGGSFYRSVDNGSNWINIPVPFPSQDVYPPAVDPYNGQHLVIPRHENTGLAESFDSGSTWTLKNTDPNMADGGGTGFVFFINTGSAGSTATTWLWIDQDDNSPITGGPVGTWRTTNSGTSWQRVESNGHPHGSSQIYQPDTSGVVFMAGNRSTGCFGGVSRSTDYGVTWTCVANTGGFEDAVWGTPSTVYAAAGWAAGGGVDPNLYQAPAPGATGWVSKPNPGMTDGIGAAAVAFDGSNYIAVAADWRGGIWRYVEPATGPTPTPTNTSLPTSTPTPGPSPTPTITATPVPSCSGVAIAPAPTSPQVVGGTIIWTATPTCTSSATPEYLFTEQVPGGTPTTVQSYSALATYTWNTAGIVSGTYQFWVQIRQVGSNVGDQGFASSVFTLTAGTPTPTVTPGGPTNTPTPTVAPTNTPTPVPGATATNTPYPIGTPLPITGLHVGTGGLANQILNTSNQPVRLRGINFSGPEYECTFGGIFDYGQPVGGDAINVPGQGFMNAVKTWQINVIRIPLNETCWLNINGYPKNITAAAYKTGISNFITLANANNIAVVLDLQWAAPATFAADCDNNNPIGNKVTNNCGLMPMPDLDHAPAFWTSVATMFGSNNSVILDLFNEPYPITNDISTASWTCLRDGCANLTTNGCAGCPNPGPTYTAAGMQLLVNTVRATGATNIIASPGITFTDTLDQWLTYKPVDPNNNIIADWHVYGCSGAPLYICPPPGGDEFCTASTCWDAQVKPVSLVVPVVVNEIGDKDCAHGFVDDLMMWADDKGIGYLGWQWNPFNCSGSPALITDYSGAPTGFGIGIRNHLLSVAGIPTATPQTFPHLCDTFPCGIAVGSTVDVTASNGTLYHADIPQPGLQQLNMQPNNGDFRPYTITTVIGLTSDQALWQTGRVGHFGEWAVNLPAGSYNITLGIAPTSTWTGPMPSVTGPYNTGQFGQDQFLQGQQLSTGTPSGFFGFCLWTPDPSSPCGGGPLNPNPWLGYTPGIVNTIKYNNILVSADTQSLDIKENSSSCCGNGRTTIAGPILIELTNPGTPTPTPVPGSTNTPTPTPTATPINTPTFTPTATPTATNNPTSGIPASETFSTGALGSYWNGGITQIGSGSFSQDTLQPLPGTTYDIRFSRSEASPSRAGAYAIHAFTPPASRIVYAQAYVSLDFIPPSAPSHSAHILGLSQSQGMSEQAYFDIRNGGIESVLHMRDGTYHTAVIDANPPGPWVGLRMTIDMSGTSPVVTWLENKTTGWTVVDQVIDTSTGLFSIPTFLRIGAWVDPQDTAWAGSMLVRFANVQVSNVPLPGRSYTTAFPLTENPISENGNWINGGVVGLNWTNIRTTLNKAFGTESGTGTGSARYDDSTALLTGPWGIDQTAKATIYITTPPPFAAEVELRLRSTITANNINGYEFVCSVAPGNQYSAIVRWNGALGDFTSIASSGIGCANGDVLGATAIGSTLTLYKNGSVLATAADATFLGGAPGMGMFLAGNIGINANYGFSQYNAKDSGNLP